MTIKQVLKLASDKFKKITDTPWLEAEVLLGYALKIDRAKLLAYPDKELTKKQYQKFKQLVDRRLRHEPIAYITKHKEFYGLDFFVDRRTLIPRPETELIVDIVVAELVSASKRSRQARPLQIADIGTGSGCIAITLVKHLKNIRIYATDVSDNILKLAKKNAKRHKVLNKITFLKGDLLKSVENSEIDIVAANLPYLTTKQWLSTKPDIRKYEPREALDGGKDGLDYIKELLYQAAKAESPPLAIILEIGGRTQANKIKKLGKQFWPKCKIQIKKDFCDLDRIAIISF